jgi:hypothetical protein
LAHLESTISVEKFDQTAQMLPSRQQPQVVVPVEASQQRIATASEHTVPVVAYVLHLFMTGMHHVLPSASVEPVKALLSLIPQL